MVIINEGIKWPGFVYFLALTGIMYEGTSAVLLTSNKLEYTFFPLNSTLFKFKVRAQHNAHIILSSVPSDKNPNYEIFLGGWKNTRSAIRWNHIRPDKAVANTTGILSANELRGFWVNCSHGFVAVGRDGELTPFLSWTNRRPSKVQYYGIRTAWGSTGEWVIDDSNVFFARVDLYDFHVGLPGIVTVDVLAGTQPSLLWKVHNSTIAESNFDATGRYHATKAFMKKNGVWEAKLIISNVTLEDIEEEIFLTARTRNKLGVSTYHVLLYAFNATADLDDDSVGLNETNEDTTTDSSALTDETVLWTTISNLPSDMSSPSLTNKNLTNTMNTDTNQSVAQTLKLLSTTTPQSVVNITVPTNISKKISPIMTTSISTLINTTPKNINIITIPMTKTNKTTQQIKSTSAIPNISQKSTGQLNNNPMSTNMPTKTSQKSRIKLTTLQTMPNITTQKGSTSPIVVPRTRLKSTTQIIPTQITYLTTVTRVPTTVTSWRGTLIQRESCPKYDKRLKIFAIVIGFLVTFLVLILALGVYAMIKHRNITGQWRFVAKYQRPISMENIYDDDNSCLIQSPQTTY